jgi:hypothetical protein
MNIEDSFVDFLALAAAADASWLDDELAFAWRSAQDEAVAAYDAWRELPGQIAYAVYRAAQDRADQAQDVLAGRAHDAGDDQPPAANAAIVASTAGSA